MTTNPIMDQKRARLRDLQRLRELAHPYLPNGQTPITEVLPLMPSGERAEVLALLDRTATWDESPETTAARQEMLLRLAEYETVARGILDSDPALEGHARATLGRLEELRNKLAGLPPAPRGDGSAS
jgi:hypothetical protein